MKVSNKIGEVSSCSKIEILAHSRLVVKKKKKKKTGLVIRYGFLAGNIHNDGFDPLMNFPKYIHDIYHWKSILKLIKYLYVLYIERDNSLLLSLAK